VAAWRAGERFLLIVLGAQTRSLSFRDARMLLQYAFHAMGIEAPPVVEHRHAVPRRSPGRPQPRIRTVLPRAS
jgi:hypothetical protein